MSARCFFCAAHPRPVEACTTCTSLAHTDALHVALRRARGARDRDVAPALLALDIAHEAVTGFDILRQLFPHLRMQAPTVRA